MKKNWKLIIISVLIGMILSTIGIVTAQTIIKSSEVTYDNSKSNGSFSNVQESLDELYNRAGYIGEEYHEEILNGAYPVLNGELIPVVIKGNGDVYYANTYTEWYSYKEKRWANAVILVDDAYAKNREDNKDKYSVGDKISEEDIESYFVWIPRYAYKLWDIKSQDKIFNGSTLTNQDYATSPSQVGDNNRIIDIVFGTKSYLDNLGYKSLTRNPETGEFIEPGDLAVGNYLEHPGFTLGNEELNGFWIGKFETGYNQANSSESAITGTENWITEVAKVSNGDSSKIIIKPNVFAWRNMNISNMFNASKEYKTELKSHMLKNTEWGAVAYLSSSIYGKCGEININNTSDYKTGFSASPNIEQNIYPGKDGLSTSNLNDKYNSSVGYQASTTGNITGVYDMSGGVAEYVAATMTSNRTGNDSGLSSDIIDKEMKAGYIDAYSGDSSVGSFNKRILGDATGELAPFYSYFEQNGEQKWHCSWYSDFATFIGPSFPWFDRGGISNSGTESGIFYFIWHKGVAADYVGFRLALAL